jgi:hypothetical protein
MVPVTPRGFLLLVRGALVGYQVGLLPCQYVDFTAVSNPNVRWSGAPIDVAHRTAAEWLGTNRTRCGRLD